MRKTITAICELDKSAKLDKRTTQLQLTHSVINNHGIGVITKTLLEGLPILESLQIEFCVLEFNETGFLTLLHILQKKDSLKLFRIEGLPSGYRNPFIIDNWRQVTAICTLIEESNLAILELHNLVYNDLFKEIIIKVAQQNNVQVYFDGFHHSIDHSHTTTPTQANKENLFSGNNNTHDACAGLSTLQEKGFTQFSPKPKRRVKSHKTKPVMQRELEMVSRKLTV